MLTIKEYQARGQQRFSADVAFTHAGRFHRFRQRGFPTEGAARAWALRMELQVMEGQEQAPRQGNRGRKPTYPGCRHKRGGQAPDPLQGPEAWTVGDVWRRFMAHIEARRAPATVRRYRCAWNTELSRYERVVFARLPQSALDAIARTTAAQTFSTLLKTARALGAVPPTGAFAPPRRVVRTRLECLEPDQARAVAEALPLPERRVFYFLLGTGCRIGEALGVNWADIDETHGVVHIRRSICERTGQERPPKGRRERAVPLSDLVRLALSGLTRGRPTTRIFAGMNRARVAYVFAEAGAAAGLPWRLHPHAVRHTAASWIVRAGVPIEQAAALLGHSSVAITWATYVHLKPNHLRDAAAVVDRALAPTLSKFH